MCLEGGGGRFLITSVSHGAGEEEAAAVGGAGRGCFTPWEELWGLKTSPLRKSTKPDSVVPCTGLNGGGGGGGRIGLESLLDLVKS